jgi:hypothetical protein
MNAIDKTGPWVDVVFLQSWDDEDVDPNEMGIQEMAEYLAQWDFGDETDAAHTRDEAPWGSEDRIYEVSVGGIDYVMTTHRFGYASLNRRPLTDGS